MNIDSELANRALSAVGQSRLQEGDKSSKSYLLIKKFYLQTMLESLETIPWTSGKRRAKLIKADIENYSDFSSAYKLPPDCAKIMELTDKSYYIVEGRLLYTDASDPILVYITNGRLPEGQEISADDYPEYKKIEYEAMFYQAFELRLASKIALELSGKEKLHQMLLQEAAVIEEAAYRNTKTLSAGRKSGKEWW
jgi:hypothetical protein|nr:MAG TPA: tail tubular protein [Bacteriophage sp.]